MDGINDGWSSKGGLFFVRVLGFRFFGGILFIIFNGVICGFLSFSVISLFLFRLAAFVIFKVRVNLPV